MRSASSRVMSASWVGFSLICHSSRGRQAMRLRGSSRVGFTFFRMFQTVYPA
jgi:hypothetical protein